MTRECFEKQHLVFSLALGVPGIILFVVAPPLGLFWLLYKRRGTSLYKDRTRVKYLFLYHSYKEKFYYWEAVKMLFILCLVCIKVYGVTMDHLERLAIFLLVIVSYAFLVIAVRPHDFRILLKLEMLSLGLIGIATYLLQFSFFGNEDQSTVQNSPSEHILTIMGLLFVVYASVLLVWIVV